MLILKKIRWKNFLSTGNNFTEIVLNKRKSTLISGSNGSGKTTLLDALVFSLFGKPYRNINIPQLVNSINKKSCVTEIEFDISGIAYKVIRGLAPKTLEIYKQGKLLDQDSNVKDYQQMFEENILKMSYKAFCQIIVLGSTNYIPFMALTTGERREIVEALLDIDVFSIMNSLLRGKISENKEELNNVDNKLILLKERANSQKNHIKVLKDKSKISIEKYQKEIENSISQNNDLEGEMAELNKEVDALLITIQHKDSLETEMEFLQKKIHENDTHIDKIEKEVSFYNNNNTCPSCSQNISSELKDQRVQHCSDNVKKLEDSSAEYGKRVNTLSTEIEILHQIGLKIDSIRDKTKEVYTHIFANNQYVKKMNNQIVDIQQESSNIAPPESPNQI